MKDGQANHITKHIQLIIWRLTLWVVPLCQRVLSLKRCKIFKLNTKEIISYFFLLHYLLSITVVWKPNNLTLPFVKVSVFNLLRMVRRLLLSFLMTVAWTSSMKTYDISPFLCTYGIYRTKFSLLVSVKEVNLKVIFQVVVLKSSKLLELPSFLSGLERRKSHVLKYIGFWDLYVT